MDHRTAAVDHVGFAKGETASTLMDTYFFSWLDTAFGSRIIVESYNLFVGPSICLIGGGTLNDLYTK